MEDHLVIAKAAVAEIVEKRSRFIGAVRPVETEEAARAFLESERKKYHDARHHCFCYRLKNGVVRYGDDGEPQGTAGQPMLNVFEREHIQDVVCVVTRYFGGILLGAGGLTRAYSKAAKEALDAAGIAKMCVWDQVDIACSYAFFDRAKLELAAQKGEAQDVAYGADILIHAVLPQENTEALTERLRELSAGAVAPVPISKIYKPMLIEK